MSCDGINALNPLCRAGAAVEAQATALVDSAFSQIAGSFGVAALSATEWLWEQLDSATAIDLTSAQLRDEMALVGSIAAVLCVGLYLIQVTTATLRREPAALGRAATGLITSFVGSALALAAARALIGAVDALSAGIVERTMGTNFRGLGSKLAFAGLAAQQNPASTLLFALLILAAAVLVWAAMMIRKLSLLIAAVLAPLAFAGATADITRRWVRRWMEFVFAMIAAKLVLVIILAIGVSVLEGAGQASDGVTQSATQLAAGTLVLLLGGLSPWIALRLCHFAGDSLTAAHSSSAVVTAGAHKVIAVPQKVAAVAVRAAAVTSGGGAAASASSLASRAPTADTFRIQAAQGAGAPNGPGPTARGGTHKPLGTSPGADTGTGPAAGAEQTPGSIGAPGISPSRSGASTPTGAPGSPPSVETPHEPAGTPQPPVRSVPSAPHATGPSGSTPQAPPEHH